MDDATFLRNLAAKGRVALLADGTAVPAPRSVLDDESRAGAAFIIDLISPEATESGDGRTFKAGTISHRDLPLPLMWQWQLDDGHKGAIIVGRIDYIEETPDGLGNARGVFDSGPWGREAERLVRGKFLRGVSGDYTNFKATVLPDEKDVKKDEAEAAGNNPLSPPSPGEEISDDQIMVTQSRLVSATLVSKPAFEGCYIRIPGPDEADPDEYEYENGEISAPPVQLTASLLLEYATGDTLERLRRLEAQEQARLSLVASAAADRIAEHRLRHERETAIARMREARNVTAAFGHFNHNFLSAKAKMQPRDKNGRFIEMGSLVRWAKGSDQRSGFHKGKVDGFDPNTKLFKVKMLDGNPGVTEAHLPGNKLEVVKALIPKTPEDAKLFLAKPKASDNPHLTTPHKERMLNTRYNDVLDKWDPQKGREDPAFAKVVNTPGPVPPLDIQGQFKTGDKVVWADKSGHSYQADVIGGRPDGSWYVVKLPDGREIGVPPEDLNAA